MQHMVNSMSKNDVDHKSVWFVDLSASNHNGEWFSDVKNLEKPSYVGTSDDIAHPIAHASKVPLAL